MLLSVFAPSQKLYVLCCMSAILCLNQINLCHSMALILSFYWGVEINVLRHHIQGKYLRVATQKQFSTRSNSDRNDTCHFSTLLMSGS